MHIKKYLFVITFGVVALLMGVTMAEYNPLSTPKTKWYKEGVNYQKEFATEKGVHKTKSGLLYKIDKPGKKPYPKASDTVTVHYEGSLINGNVFDSSIKRGTPTTFKLNAVIPGWTEGLQLIGTGGSITLVIPPDLAYGSQSLPGIPAHSTLIFHVQLIKIQH